MDGWWWTSKSHKNGVYLSLRLVLALHSSRRIISSRPAMGVASSFFLTLPCLRFSYSSPVFFFSFFSFSLDCINFHMSSWMRKRCVLSSRCPRRNFQTFWERGYRKRVRHLNAEAYPSQRMWCVPTVSILFSFPSKRYQMNSWLPPKKGWRTCGIFENFREHLEQHMCEGTWN